MLTLPCLHAHLPATCPLQADVQAGQQLLERWGTRNEAIAQLEAVVEGVSGPVASQTSPPRRLEGMSDVLPFDLCRSNAQCESFMMVRVYLLTY